MILLVIKRGVRRLILQVTASTRHLPLNVEGLASALRGNVTIDVMVVVFTYVCVRVRHETRPYILRYDKRRRQLSKRPRSFFKISP
jgi:hypothetical protein